MWLDYGGYLNKVYASCELTGFCLSANVAQSVEQIIRNDQVVGSIPTVGSRGKRMGQLSSAGRASDL